MTLDTEKLVFLDTETTGVEKNDRLCQVAYWHKGEEFEELFKPPMEIAIDAMVVSHITNEMVADKEAFVESAMAVDLKEIFDTGGIFVAHNAAFDKAMLEREGFDNIDRVIDTWKVARHLDTEGTVPRYNLQYLRYFFKLQMTGVVVAHDALGDVRVLKSLFDRYYHEMLETLQSPEAVLAEMIEITKRPILHRAIPFGKYKNQRVEDIARQDPGYLKWLRDTKRKDLDEKGLDDEGWIYTIDHYLS